MDRINNIYRLAKKESFFYGTDQYPDINIKNYTDMQMLPILKKEMLQKNEDKILIYKYHNANKKLLRLSYTSGSTGKITKVWWNIDDYNRSNLLLWRLRKKWYGISPEDKHAFFATFEYIGTKLKKPKRIEINTFNNRLSMSTLHMTEEDMLSYCNAIIEFKPKWLQVSTSILIRLITVMKKHKLFFPSLQYIELNGEFVSDDNMLFFRSFFNISIANMYGAKEVNCIAFECPYHNMHILEENVYCEVDASNRTAIVTSLQNFVMPIIRYEVGDVIELKNNNVCQCGTHGKIITKILGRTSDVVKNPANKYISPYALSHIIFNTNVVFNNAILQFKIIQKNIDNLYFIVVLQEDSWKWHTVIKEHLEKELFFLYNEFGLKSFVEVRNRLIDHTGNKYKFFETIQE